MTKRKLFIFLLLSVLSFSVAEKAEAQLLKKLFGKHHKKTDDAAGSEKKAGDAQAAAGQNTAAAHKETRKERKARKKKEKQEQKDKAKKDKEARKKNKGKQAPAAAPAETAVVKKWASLEYPESERKKHYRVDILAPLYLDELVKKGYVVRDIPEKAAPGLDFYKGVQIAADTLKKAGFDVDLYVHDVASLLESTDMLVSKNMLDSSDLIIGAVSAKDVAALGAFAKRKKINFISALSGSDGNIKDNQFFTLLQPSLKSSCEGITNRLEQELHGRKALLLYRTSLTADDNAAKFFTAVAPGGPVQFNAVQCNLVPKKEALAPFVSNDQPTIVVIPVTDLVYADTLLRNLSRSFPAARFEVYGMPSWNGLASLHKAGLFSNITVNVTTPFNFDPATDAGKYVTGVFAREYGGKPAEFVFRGYEATFWYVNLLKRHGTMFNKQYDDVETAPFTKFDVRPQWDDQGNVLYQENRCLYMSTYADSKQTTKK